MCLVLTCLVDIEGHLGKDGRYYVVDTARVFPPEPLWKSQIALYFSGMKRFPIKEEALTTYLPRSSHELAR